MTWGEQLAEARRARGFTQEELAERLGVSRQAVAKWERDAARPGPGNARALRDLLGEDFPAPPAGKACSRCWRWASGRRRDASLPPRAARRAGFCARAVHRRTARADRPCPRRAGQPNPNRLANRARRALGGRAALTARQAVGLANIFFEKSTAFFTKGLDPDAASCFILALTREGSRCERYGK